MLVESRSGVAPVLVLDVPSDFHQVPLDSRTESRTAAQLQVVSALGLSSSAQREAISLYLEALSIRLASGNVVGTAFCAVQLDGHPSSATLTVATHPTHTHDTCLAVSGAAEAMRRDARYQHVEILVRGGRPVVSAVAERRANPAETSSGRPGATLREITVFVPVAGQEQAAMLTLSTPCLDDWETYRGLVLDIGRSVRAAATHAGSIG